MIRPRVTADLRAWIAALLRRRYRGPAIGRLARAPVRGVTSYGYPPLRGMPDIVNSWPISLLISALRLEHGLLSLNLADLIAFPATTGPIVHLSESLGAYYAIGSLIPDSDPPRTEPLVGRLVQSQLTPPPDWPDGAPEISDQTHPGLAGLGPLPVRYLVQEVLTGGYTQRIFPSRYTGPARQLVQAWVGAGLDSTKLSARVPDGWSTVAGSLGLTQDPETHTWWILEIGQGGLRACQMAPTELTSIVHDWVSDDTLVGMDAALALTYVLADMRPAGAPIVLITAEDMAQVYAGAGEYSEGARTMIVDDALPSGAAGYGLNGDTWSWVSTPAPHSGALCHVSAEATGARQHAYTGGPAHMVYPGDTIEQWVWIPDGAAPRQIQISFWQPGVIDGWATPVVYWGEDLMPQWGGSARYRIGDVPAGRDTWVCLTVDVAQIGMSGLSVAGFGYSVYGGIVFWDATAIKTADMTWGDGDAESLQGGWIWSDDGQHGSIVTHRVLFPGGYGQARESLLASIEIAFQAGVPEATLTLSERVRYRVLWSCHKFWSGDPAELSLLRDGQIWAGNADCGATAPIIVFYDGNVIKIMSYYQVNIYPNASSRNTQFPRTCDGSGAGMEYSDSLMVRTGGFGFAPPPDVIIGSGTITRRTGGITPGEEGDWVEWGGCQSGEEGNWYCGPGKAGCGEDGCADLADLNTWPLRESEDPPWDIVDGGHQIRNRYGSALGRLDVLSVGGANASQIIVYIASAPDVLWTRDAQVADTWQRVVTDFHREVLVSQKQRLFISYLLRYSNPPVYSDWFGPPHEGQVGHDWGSPTQSGGWDLVNIQSTEETQTTQGSGDFDVVARCRLPGVEIAASGEGWEALDANGLEPVSVPIGAAVSAAGSALYRPEPGGDWEAHAWTGGMPNVLGDSVGYALAWVGAI